MKKIMAVPTSLRFTDNGYDLVVEITEGPAAFVGRIVKVKFRSDQLDKIAEWNPNPLMTLLMLDEKK